jgi:hypothetical protein
VQSVVNWFKKGQLEYWRAACIFSHSKADGADETERTTEGIHDILVIRGQAVENKTKSGREMPRPT